MFDTALTVVEPTRKEVKTWVPVNGERVTFPPLLKQTKGEVVSTVLTKIESP